MNISSVIVLSKEKDKGELILSIEAENLDAETEIFRKIETTPGVISARLAYAYSENEVAQDMKNVLESAEYPEWLNKETHAREIPYSGKLKI